MKKSKFSLGSLAVAILISASMSSCNKADEQIVPNRPTRSASTSARTSPVAVSVDPLGFLDFTTTDDVAQLTDWLTSGTHQDARNFMSTLNFTSKGVTLYGDPMYDNKPVTEAQAADYFLTAANSIKIDGIVMRVTNNGDYVYTLAPINVNTPNYNALISNTYDYTLMNRFVTGLDGENMIDFVALHQTTPYGYDDPSTPPSTPTTGAKFWGWGRWHYAGFEHNGEPVFVRYYYVLGYQRHFETAIGEIP